MASNQVNRSSFRASDVVTWDRSKVEAWLVRHNITGCGEILARYKIDGKAFLNLDLRSLSEWTGLSIIQRSKIVALLNELGPESYRKQIAASASISFTRRLATAAAEASGFSVSSTSVRPSLSVSAPRQSFPAAKKNDYTIIKPLPKPLPAKRSLPQPPPPPPKPQHLKPCYLQSLAKLLAGNGQASNASSASTSASAFNNSNSQLPDGVTSFPHGNGVVDNGENAPSLINTEETTDEEVIAYCSDSFSSDDFTSDEENDENNQHQVTDALLQNKAQKPDKKKSKKKLLYVNKLLNLDPKKAGGDPLGTPPLPPSRTARSSQYSSQSSLLGSETAVSHLPLSSSAIQTLLAQSTSLSELRDPHPHKTASRSSLNQIYPPSNPPPPVPLAPGNAQVPQPVSALFANSVVASHSSLSLDGASQQSLVVRGAIASSPLGASGSNRSSGTSSSDSDAAIQPWYFNADRRLAEPCLMKHSDGTFLIRPSKHGGSYAPFTLSLQFNHRIFHVHIRRRLDGRFALGSEKPAEDTFLSLSALVQHHQREPLHLHAGNKFAGTTRLTRWPESLL